MPHDTNILPRDPGGWNVVNGDAVELMRRLPDACIDAVITDPPYGTADANKVAIRGNRRIEEFDIEWDKQMPLDWITEAARVLKRGAALITFVDAFEVTTARDALRDAGLRPLRPLYWVKTGPPHCPRANFTNGVEVAVFARKPGRVLHWPMNSRGGYAGTLSNVWTGSTDARSSIRRTGHPTQKPEALMRWLADIVCPSDGLVLDPYCGSGTTGIGVLGTGVEAATTNRRFLGIERDPTECHVARARFLGLAGAVAGARAREGMDQTDPADDVFALLDLHDG